MLTQIIVEEESKGHSLLPIGFLRQLISFYGDSLAGFVPSYLELTMETFTRNQEQMRAHVEDAFGGFYPFKQMEEMGKTNVAAFQRAMEMFAPFGGAGGSAGGSAAGGTAGEEDSELAELKLKLDAMQRQLDAIARKNSKP